MKAAGVIKNIISALFLLITGALGILSLFVHGSVNFETYEEKIEIASRNPLTAMVEEAVFLLLLCLLVCLVSGIGNRRTWSVTGQEKGQTFKNHPKAGPQRENTANAEDKMRQDRAGHTRRFAWVLCAVEAGIVLAGGFWWIRVNPYPPYSDQKKVWDAAVALAEGNPSAIDTAYFWIYPHQKSMVVVFWPIAKLLGTDPAHSIRLVNVICAALTVMGIGALCQSEAFLSLLLCVLFLPIVIYSCFVYGTLLSAAACVWAFYGVIRFNQTGKVRYGALPVILIPFAGIAYTGTKIAMIAAVIALLVPLIEGKCGTRKWYEQTSLGRNGSAAWRHNSVSDARGTGEDGSETFRNGQWWRECLLRIVLAALIVLLSSAAASLAKAAFTRASGIPSGDDYPVLPDVYMGITSTEEDAVAGPGSFVTSDTGWNGSNAAEVDAIYQEKIKETLQEYLHHEKSWRFFLRKTEYQWLDPWFSSLTMTCSLWMRDVTLPGWLESILTGRPVRWAQHFLTVLMSAVYLLAAWNAVCEIWSRHRDRKPVNGIEQKESGSGVKEQEKSTENRHSRDGWGSFLLEIYFLGGFAFQLIWESKARYCFPYFLCLIPLAVCGAVQVWKRFRMLNAEKLFVVARRGV